MNDTTTLRDHSQPCEHEQPKKLRGYWVCDWCPGGRERRMKPLPSSEMKVWLEVDDE